MLVGQVDDAIKGFHQTAAEFGLIAAMFVGMLCAVSFAVWKWGSILVKSMTENNERIATATERMAASSESTSEAIKSISGNVSALSLTQQKQNKALALALDAIKEPDETVRHRMIDEARRELA